MKGSAFPPPLSSPSLLILEVMHRGGSLTNGKCLDPWVTGRKGTLCQTEVNVTRMSNKFLPPRGTKLSRNIYYRTVTYLILIKAMMGHGTEITCSLCRDMGRSLETLSIKEKVNCQITATEWNILCWNKIMKVGYSFPICRNVCIKA